MNSKALKDLSKRLKKTIASKIPLLSYTFPEYISKLNVHLSKDYSDLYSNDLKDTLRYLEKDNHNNMIIRGSKVMLRDFLWLLLWNINNGKFEYKEYNKFHIYCLDVLTLLTKRKKDDEERLLSKFKEISDFMEDQNVILCISDFDLLIENDLINIIMPLIQKGVRIIGAIEDIHWMDDYLDERIIYNYFSIQLLHDFEYARLDNTLPANYFELSKNYLEKSRGIKFDDDAFKRVIDLASSFGFNFPLELAFNIFDVSISIALEKGHKSVQIDDVMAFLDSRKRDMKRSDSKTLRDTAIHEAGHFIVHKYMDRLDKIKITSVTIIPSGASLGFNSVSQDMIEVEDKDFVNDYLAFALGGRAAEKVLLGNPSIGSMGDMIDIVAKAFSSIVFGVMDDVAENNAHILSLLSGDSGLSSDEDKKSVNMKLNKLVADAESRAEKIIIEHRDEVVRLSDALYEKHILFVEDLKDF